MFCTKCGAKMYDDSAEVCSVCGALLTKKDVPQESETEKLNRVINEIKQERSVNDMFNDFLEEMKNQSASYESARAEKPKVQIPRAQKPIIEKPIAEKPSQEEWLNPEAIKEIWSVPQSAQEPKTQDYEESIEEWFDDTDDYEDSSFHLMEHPIAVTAIVAFIMAVISVISVVLIFVT